MDTRIQKKELIMLFDNKEILKHITDGVIGIDSGKIIKMFSPGAEKIFNYSSTEIIDKPFSSLIETTESLEEKLKKKIYPIRNISGTGKSDISIVLDIVGFEKKANGMELWVVRDQTQRIRLDDFLDKYHDNIQNELNSIVTEKTKDLENLTLAIVSVLESANKFNDSETGNHILRVSEYSHSIAKSMNCSDDFINKIRLFSSLHDVGKVGISDALLKKPGNYTKMEFDLMKQHVVIGGRILNIPGIDPMAKNIALYHHEKWDGSGYVHGLRGDEIPLEARIVAAADIYDALRSKRIYKDRFSEEKTLEILSSLSGKELNPQIVEIIKSNTTEFRNIYNNHN